MFAAITAVLSCNTNAEYAYNSANHGGHTPFHGGLGGLDLPLSGGTAPLTLLPQDAGDASPACLDGSPYGYYFQPSRTNSTKWTISIEGGGWCYNEQDCFKRASTPLGSSLSWAPTAGCRCMNVKDDASADDPLPLDNDCNCLYMPYGDGASFSGFRAERWPVPPWLGGNGTQKLTFRGLKNFDATVAAALKLGLSGATDFVLTGGSAGGLSTFLHADRIAAVLRAEAPSAKVRAAPVVGYFLDHANYKHTNESYTNRMKYIYSMQNLTFGADGGLMEACSRVYPSADEQFYCFMSPHAQKVIQTPFFVFNSKFDAWQLGNELQTNWVDDAERAAVVQYGKDFDAQFAPVIAEDHGHGAVITTCICHGCPWNTLTVPGSPKNAYMHYASWMVGNDTGVSAFHVDDRAPNGGGAINDTHCAKFP